MEQEKDTMPNSDLKIQDDSQIENDITFKSLGISEVICKGCEAMKWTKPTEIQLKTIPPALEGRDIIGLSKTGSGKTGAFVIPILEELQKKPSRIFALVITPTRELAFQISDQFKALGSFMGIKCVVIVGGMDAKAQKQAISENPHIIIATPGRLVDIYEKSRGFELDTIKFLVMDEADKLLGKDYEQEIDTILQILPRDRRTYLFSATMTEKVEKLHRASLKDPVKVSVSERFDTVETLEQYCVPVSSSNDLRLSSLIQLAMVHIDSAMIIFMETCLESLYAAQVFHCLGLPAIPLNGQMHQNKRINALEQFKAKKKTILIATDVGSRGIDIKGVDVVINFDVPPCSKDYCHRVGRTARAGNQGKAFTCVTKSDYDRLTRLESDIKIKLPQYSLDLNKVKEIKVDVQEAMELAKRHLGAKQTKSGHKRKGFTETKHKFKRRK